MKKKLKIQKIYMAMTTQRENIQYRENRAIELIKEYFNHNSIVNIQLNSYNDLIMFGIQEIIDQRSSIQVFPDNDTSYTLEFKRCYVGKPQIVDQISRETRDVSPLFAIHNKITYEAPIYCDISEKFVNKNEEDKNIDHMKIHIGNFPVMTRSCICHTSEYTPEEFMEKGLCPNDFGGYFIIKGSERVLISHMRKAYDQVIVSKEKKRSKSMYKAYIRSMSSQTAHSALVQAFIDKKQNILFELPRISQHIPAGIVFKALGYTKIEDIRHLIGLEHPRMDYYINIIWKKSFVCEDQKSALNYIVQFATHTIEEDRKENYAWQIVENELFPHLGITSTIKQQACFLGHLLNKLFSTAVGLRSPDDLDNYKNKRIDTAGVLLQDLVRNMHKKYMDSLEKNLSNRRQIPNVINIINRMNMFDKLVNCFTSQCWSIQKNPSYARKGVSQILDRMTYYSSLSHLRRLVIDVGKQVKNSVRNVHSTQFGYVCPVETPEGEGVGVVLNFALTCKISRNIPIHMVQKEIFRITEIISIEDIAIENIKNYSRVFLNNVLIGFTQFPRDVVEKIESLRKISRIDKEVSVLYDLVDDDVKIYCDEGRFIRPVLNVDEKTNNLHINDIEKYDWDSLVSSDVIRYIDAYEMENSVIAMYPHVLENQRSDFCEIHPCVMLGVIANEIPFPDHSQSPRNTYQSSMGRQALGIPLLSYRQRTDTVMYILHYPQRPLVSTKVADILKFNEMPSGLNTIVAIASYSGYNQEDSVIVNKGAVDRGMFHLTVYKTYNEAENKKKINCIEEICMPPENNLFDEKNERLRIDDPAYFKRKYANYNLLDERGIIYTRIPLRRKCMETTCPVYLYEHNLVNCPKCGVISENKFGGGPVKVEKGDVIIGKTMVTLSKNGSKKHVDISRVIQSGEEGIVDRVHVTTTPSGYRMVNVIIRKVRVPVLGDKLAARSAQKGTIGMIFPHEDMPYTSSGIVPDVIMNPLAMPSRMTTNQLIECVIGKESCISGNYGDATPFTQNSVNVADKIEKEMIENLKTKGFEEYGFGTNGWETMYNGMTGERLKSRIFIGPTYYQRLKHMVDDKIHARSTGFLTMLTRQPLEGRSRGGGHKVGEMERDCIVAHGTSRMLKERLFDVSDPFQIPTCGECGFISNNGKDCPKCNSNNVILCHMPYASKLLFQEISTMAIRTQFFARD